MIFRNKQIERAGKKALLCDFYLQNSQEKKPLVIFIHGFKGYKDWGNWNEFAQYLYHQNMHFLKFNFSHNGGTLENPIDFPDLDAFAENTYSKELEDLGDILDFVEGGFHVEFKKQCAEIILVGHSRGGAIATLKTAEDKRVNKLICLAAVSDLESRFNTYDLDKWKKEGKIFIANSRTKQEMPINYSFYSDFLKNKKRLDIPELATKITVPSLVIHSKNDPIVLEQEAKNLHKWIKKSELFLLESGGHTFGMKHPKAEEKMPKEMEIVSEKILDFIR